MIRKLEVGDVVILDIPETELKANANKAAANLDIYIVTATESPEVSILQLGGGYGTWVLESWCILLSPATPLRQNDPVEFSQTIRGRLRELHNELKAAKDSLNKG